MNATRWLPAVLILVVLGPQHVQAAPQSPAEPRITRLDIGLGGIFKVGYWTPVRITVSGGPSDFVGNIKFTLVDSDDIATVFVQGSPAAIRVAAHGQWSGWRYIKLGRVNRGVRATLHDSSGTVRDTRVEERAAANPSTWQWVVTAGPDVKVDEASAFLVRMRSEKLIASHLTDPAQFPDRWYGYEGVNLLLAPAGEQNPLEMLSDTQFEALERWIQMGGRLVFSAGKRAGDLFQEGNRFFALRPGEFKELDQYWKASGLESFARAAKRVPNSEQAPMAVFSSTRGRVLCFEGAGGKNDRPLAVQYPFGLGEITYFALDLDRPPLSLWPERARLLARLLQTRSEEEDSAIGSAGLGRVTHLGFDDLTGQLRSALDQFPSVTRVRFSWIAALIVLYITLLGPLDFFGLRKLKRPHWTWVTFPLLLIVFSATAIWLGSHWRGDHLQVNQVDVVDIDIEHAFTRGTTWANIYSPGAANLDIDLQPDPATRVAPDRTEVLASWHGLPGSGLGGMTAPTSVDVLSEGLSFEYTIDNVTAANGLIRSRIEGLPIPTASTKGLIARWWAKSETLAPSRLRARDGGLLQGSIVNPLQVELARCFVYFENWAYRLDQRLEPGDSVDLEDLTPLDLKWLLTRRRMVESSDISTPWDRVDLTDPARIVEMLMFHGAAGGQAYTKLTHHYQAYVDLSRHLRTWRAILVGRSETPASRLTSDGQSLADRTNQHITFYRIVIPVQRVQEEPSTRR